MTVWLLCRYATHREWRNSGTITDTVGVFIALGYRRTGKISVSGSCVLQGSGLLCASLRCQQL
jgi:hypothetical protein